MLKLFIAVLVIAGLSVVSYATSVGVTTSKYAADTGVLTNVYFENSNPITSTTPSILSALTLTASTGSLAISRGSTDYVYSTEFTSARNVAAGSWVVDFWAKGATSGTMTVALAIVTSTGTVQTTIGSATTPTLSTSEGQAAITVAGSAASIPADGYVRAAFTAPSGTGNPTSFTLYWGKAQGTNFQVPMATVSS